MLFKRLSAFFGSSIGRIWFFTDKLFLYDDVLFGLKRLGMAGQVTISDPKQLFERSKVGIVIDHQYRHDAESDTMIKGLVYILDDIFQNYLLSYLKCIIVPYTIWHTPKPKAQNSNAYPDNSVDTNPMIIIVIPKYRTSLKVYLLAFTHDNP